MTGPTVRIVLDVDLTRRYSTAAEVIEDLAAQTRHGFQAHAAVVRLGESAVRVADFELPAALARTLHRRAAAIDIRVPSSTHRGWHVAQAVQRHLAQYAAADIELHDTAG